MTRRLPSESGPTGSTRLTAASWPVGTSKRCATRSMVSPAATKYSRAWLHTVFMDTLTGVDTTGRRSMTVPSCVGVGNTSSVGVALALARDGLRRGADQGGCGPGSAAHPASRVLPTNVITANVSIHQRPDGANRLSRIRLHHGQNAAQIERPVGVFVVTQQHRSGRDATLVE